MNDQRLENGPFSSVAPRRRRGFRPVPLRLLLPNIVTLIALCLGMPAPAGAIVGLLPIYLRFGFDLSAPPPGVAVFESLYVMAIALLMASRVPHFSGKSIGRVPREHLAVFLVGVAAALLLVFVFPMQSLVAVTLAYLASIPFAIRRYRELDRAGEAGTRPDAKAG